LRLADIWCTTTTLLYWIIMTCKYLQTGVIILWRLTNHCNLHIKWMIVPFIFLILFFIVFSFSNLVALYLTPCSLKIYFGYIRKQHNQHIFNYLNFLSIFSSFFQSHELDTRIKCDKVACMNICDILLGDKRIDYPQHFHFFLGRTKFDEVLNLVNV
jgi:hypothetical protein